MFFRYRDEKKREKLLEEKQNQTQASFKSHASEWESSVNNANNGFSAAVQSNMSISKKFEYEIAEHK